MRHIAAQAQQAQAAAYSGGRKPCGQRVVVGAGFPQSFLGSPAQRPTFQRACPSAGSLPPLPSLMRHHHVPWHVAVRDPHWKLVRYLDPSIEEEIYDLQDDPEELVNLIAKPEHKEVLTALCATLAAELKRTEAGFE